MRAQKMNVWYFLVRVGGRGNLFAVLSRVVIKGSRGLGKIERQDEGWRNELKDLRESCSRQSARVGMAAEYEVLM